jgi:long-chain acyl-CoA synthetase
MSIVTAHRDGDIRPETSGPPLPGVKIQLSEEGEILVQNEAMFVGYYKNKAATDKMFVNGWYKSGDFGHIDDDGHLVVIDRMEDLRSLRGNERFSPQFLEARLRFCPFIKEVMVVGGEERTFPCTIVSIDLENVGTWAESRKIVYTTFADLSQKDEVLELLSAEIEKINKTVPKSSRIMKFISLYKEFDPDEEEVTRTRKLRRSFLELRYKALIQALYSEQRVLEVEMPIVYRDGRKGAIKGSMKINTVN